MTTQNYWETIHEIFPHIKQQQVVKDLDISQKKFAKSVGNLTGRGELASVSTAVAWNLPSDFGKLLDITLYDTSGNPLYLGDYQLAYEIEFGKFYLYSLTSTPITTTPSGIDKIYLHYEKLPTTLTAVTTALEIPLEYRDALLYDVLCKYFSIYPITMGVSREGEPIKGLNLNAASYHRNEYDRIRIQAKRDFNSRDLTMKDAIHYDHAGKYELPRRTNDSTVNSTTVTQITALGDIYSKYALYHLNNSGDGGVAEQLTVGYTTIDASITGVTFTITSTAEFGTDTQIIANDGNVSWVRDSSSQITVTVPLAYTLIALEIYERI